MEREKRNEDEEPLISHSLPGTNQPGKGPGAGERNGGVLAWLRRGRGFALPMTAATFHLAVGDRRRVHQTGTNRHGV
jgi:hypothetical protein